MLYWFKKCFKHYADFQGRACRKEYWMFALSNLFVVWLGIGILYLFYLGKSMDSSGVQAVIFIMMLYYLAILIPSLSVTVRRLHDVGKSGNVLWLIFLINLAVAILSIFFKKSINYYIIASIIYFITSLWLLYLLVKPGDRRTNRYGKVPEDAPYEPLPDDDPKKSEIMFAAEDGDLEKVKMLAEQGANLNETSENGDTALLWAAVNEHTELVDFLIEKGAAYDKDYKTAAGLTYLLAFTSGGMTKYADELIKKGADINAADSDGYNALMYAANFGRFDIADLLIDAGCFLNDKANDGRTAYQIAIDNGYTDWAEYLLSKGAKK